MTPARITIEPEFLHFFYEFSTCNDVYLVTGSDVYERDINVYRDDWELPRDVEMHLENELLFSKFPVRNGEHIERRPGGVNFSILGRGLTCFVEREEYVKWDQRTNERKEIARRLKLKFPELEVNIGGQTGLDLGAPGCNKSQILRDFRLGEQLVFFGDMMEEGQNDYALAKAVQEVGGSSHCVNGWKDTMMLLNKIESP